MFPVEAIIAEQVVLPVVALYLIIACNFIKDTIGCNLHVFLESHVLARHFVGIFLLFFLVVVTDQKNAEREIYKNILLAIGIYIWFLITTKAPLYIMIIVLVLLMSSYMVSLSKKRNQDANKTDAVKKAELWQYFLANLAFILSIIGFIIYIINKKHELGNDFMFIKLFSKHCNFRDK